MTGSANIHIPADLAKAAIVGNREAAGCLFQLLSQAILSVAWRMLARRSAAAESLQDVFNQVLDSAGSIVHPGVLLGLSANGGDQSVFHAIARPVDFTPG